MSCRALATITCVLLAVPAAAAVATPAASGWHVLTVDGAVEIRRQDASLPATPGAALLSGDIVAPGADGWCELISDAAVVLALGTGETFVADAPAAPAAPNVVDWLATRIAEWTGRGREAALRSRAGDGAPIPVFPAPAGRALPGQVTLLWLGADDDASWRVRLLDADRNLREQSVTGAPHLTIDVAAGQTVTWQVEATNGARSPMRTFRTLSAAELGDLELATRGRDAFAVGVVYLVAGLHAEAWNRFALLADDERTPATDRWRARVLDEIGLTHEQDAIEAQTMVRRAP